MATDEKVNEAKECVFCHKKAVYFDSMDEAGHFNYVCKKCGEPQPD
jgi:hypothetical protein